MADKKPNRPRDAREPRDARDSRPPMAPVAAKSGVPHGATELGWLPDCVYTGEKFETGLAFFADAVGRITRFSREPADLANARRLQGQAALPGLVNAHSHAFQRVLRGRTEQRSRPGGDPRTAWQETLERAVERLTDEDVFDVARMVFMEMLLAGITCVGEFHGLHHRPDGTPWADPNFLGLEVLRAARDVGIRIVLLNGAMLRADFKMPGDSAPPRFRSANADQFIRETEALRVAMARDFPADEAWLGVAPQSLAAVPLDQFKAIATYAHGQRMRLHTHVSTRAEENAACIAEYGRTPVALLAEHGVIDKRFTVVNAIHLTDDEVKLLGTARAAVCVCPIAAANLALGFSPVEKLLAAGAGVAFGTDNQTQTELLKDARLLEYRLRMERQQRGVFGADAATALFNSATVVGARSLGATSGALEVGRPADFFTVNLYDPSIAGADPGTLLAGIVFALERRAIRDVWIGGRQRLANGRHPLHGPIVGRFVELQRRLWGG